MGIDRIADRTTEIEVDVFRSTIGRHQGDVFFHLVVRVFILRYLVPCCLYSTSDVPKARVDSAYQSYLSCGSFAMSGYSWYGRYWIVNLTWSAPGEALNCSNAMLLIQLCYRKSDITWRQD